METSSQKPSRTSALLQASLVTFLWSTSWILIKFGLSDSLPAVTFAGLRYTLASLCLAPFVLLNPRLRQSLRNLKAREWGGLAVLGLVVYTLTQGAQFLSLAHLPTATLNLLLNLTAGFVGLAGIFTLHERPTALQWIGILLTMGGVGVYFLPVHFPQGQVLGLAAALACLLGNIAASILGRRANRGNWLPPLVITFVSMGIGSVVMLGIGLAAQGMGRLTWSEWAIIAWLASVNTALTFVLWNNTLRTLNAVESSVINSLMMPQIAILALIFLGERLALKEVLGLVLVGLGVLAVQLKRLGK